MNHVIQHKLSCTLNEIIAILIFTTALLASGGFPLAAICIQGLAIVALLNLTFMVRLDSMEWVLDNRKIKAALGLAVLFMIFTCLRGAVVSVYLTQEIAVQYAIYGTFFLILLPIVRKPVITQRLIFYIATLGFLVALTGTAHRFTGSWDLLHHDQTYLSANSFGLFYYENTYGAFAALFLPMCVALLFYRAARLEIVETKPWLRFCEYFMKSLNSGIFLLMVASFVMGVGLIATNARASLLIMAVFYLVVVLVIFPWRVKVLVLGLVSLSVGAFALMADVKVLNYTFSGLQWDRIWEDGQTRVDILKMNALLFLERPWVGWGAGTYMFESPRWLVGGDDALNIWHQHVHAHGSYMDLLVEGGIVGMFLGLSMVVIIPITAILKKQQTVSLYRKLMKWQAVAALASFAPMLLFDSHLREQAVVMLMLLQLAILIASIQGYSYAEESILELRERLLWTPAKAVAVLIAGICVMALGTDLMHQYKIYAIRSSHLPKDQMADQLTRLEPMSSEVWSESARAHYRLALQTKERGARLELLKKAQISIQRAIDIMPDYAPYWHQKAKIYHSEGDVAHAIEMYKKSIELSPRNLKYKADLMLLYVYEGRDNPSQVLRSQWNEAARRLYEEIKISPDYPTNGFESLRIYQGARITNEQRQYMLSFVKIADKYRTQPVTMSDVTR